MSETKRSIRVLVYKTEEFWVARCIDVDLSTCGTSLDELIQNVERQLETQIYLDQDAGREPFSCLKPAPDRFHQRYEAGRPLEWPLVEKAGFRPVMALAS